MAYEPATVKDLKPTINEISDRIAALAKAPNANGFTIENAPAWADLVRAVGDNCCASHLVAEMREYRNEMQHIVATCEDTNCDDVVTHQFIHSMVSIIDECMSKKIRELTVQHLLHERVN